MKNYKIFVTFILMLFIIVFLGLNYIVSADTGAKPSITIKLENIDTENYLIDLLVYDESGENYESSLNYNGKEGEQYNDVTGYNSLKTITVEEIEKLHKINYDGWISEGTRWNAYLLFADCSGNSEYEHYFSYFGTPETYKVVIMFNDGETRVTDVINRTDFQSEITIDINTMEVVKKDKNNESTETKTVIHLLLITVIVEVVIALIMKIKNMKIIIGTNAITNILLQILLINMPQSYIAAFVISEILIFVLEYLIYAKCIKKTSRIKILCYTLIANLTTLVLTFVL